MIVSIIVPTLGRPQSIEPLVDSIVETSPLKNVEVIFVVDGGDANTFDAIDQQRQRVLAVTVTRKGTFPIKTNAGVREAMGDWVALVADDVRFREGWYEHAAAVAEGHDVIGTSDLSPATADGKHVTMPIVRCEYIDNPGAAWGEPGKAFHEGYHHNFVETELWELALVRGVAARAPLSVIEHLHPDWGKAEMDRTYKRGAKRGWVKDKALFLQRRKEWEGVRV